MAEGPLSAGAALWWIIGAALVAWGVCSACSPRLPGVLAIPRWFAGSWLGRVLALCAWGGAGWHLFCQRP